jgi:hypothetical protein
MYFTNATLLTKIYINYINDEILYYLDESILKNFIKLIYAK